MRNLIITGMPRSGTSWLGQIINSDPRVRFRTEPLFAYRFKNSINPTSSCHEVNEFINALYDVDDDFILQKQNQKAGFYPEFNKTDLSQIMAFKTTRHFELLEKYLSCVADLSIIAIIRHPCAIINSWFNSYREFEKKGCQPQKDWRSGGCRKNEIGEYWGFDDWLLSTAQFVQLSQQYKNFHLVRYSDLVENTNSEVSRLFVELNLDIQAQTFDFITACNERHDDDAYSVFKDKQLVHQQWVEQLDINIANTIIQETLAADLGYFLE